MSNVTTALPDGVSIVSSSTDERIPPPPPPPGTFVTVTATDRAGNPYLTIFLPPISYPTAQIDIRPVPRPVPPSSRLCIVCNRLGTWIETGLREKQWPLFCSKLGRHTLNNVFIMGFLDQILETTACVLCRLVSAALRDCFTNPLEIPVRCQTPSGVFRQRCALHLHGLISGGTAIGLSIALSSATGLVLSMGHHLEKWGQRFAPSIWLHADDIVNVPARLHGGVVARLLNPTRGDLTSIRQCYSVCKREHGSICEIPRNSRIDFGSSQDTHTESLRGGLMSQPMQASNFLLIDIENMCITTAPGDCQYLTLSYVWGRAPFLQLTRSNRVVLQSRYGLLTQNLPQLFQDAIGVTQLLGERYLWIDALCIVQDDDSNKEEQILQMDKIFLSAALTIVSADGQSVQAGLSGFLDGSRVSTQVVEHISGLRFVQMSPPLKILMEGFKWHTRGWTYQEAMLSKRVLVFTPCQLYYICNLSSFSEDEYSIQTEHQTKHQTTHLINSTREIERHPLYSKSERHTFAEMGEFRITQHWFFYNRLVEDFSTRDITCESDILKALTGILRAMTDPHVEKYICGLPSTVLEWALLWQPRGPLRRRSCSSNGHPFPSWSWIGWVGPVKMIHHTHPGTIMHAVDWLFHTPDPSTRRSHNLCSTAEGMQLQDYTSEEFRQDLLPYNPEATPLQIPDFHHSRWLSLEQVSDILQADNPHFQSNPARYMERVRRNQPRVDSLHPLIESGVLNFATTSSTFSIDATPTPYTYRGFSTTSTSSFRITYDTAWVGTIHLDKQSTTSIIHTHAPAEFIFLSLTHQCFEESQAISAHEVYGKNTFDVDMFEPGDLQNRKEIMGNVMWIRWENGIAFRVGVGQIHIHAWNASKPVMKRIWLS